MSGRVVLVGAGPGAPDLITVRGQRALEEADVVLYDALVDLRILANVRAECTFVGKRSGRHALPQDEICALLVRLAKAGKTVVRLKGGDPLVLGRGGEEAAVCAREGVPFEIVPGVTSAIAVPAAAGIPVTHRGIADSFVVVSAHCSQDGAALSIPPYSPATTVVLLMGVATLPIWHRQLVALGYPADCPIAFVMEGTTDSQRLVVTRVGDVLERAPSAGVRSPAVIVIGDVVGIRGQLCPDGGGGGVGAGGPAGKER
ncbi:MAG: uroporphyrinogen-III C-methyltransferase [Candidatus Schekmanbacteria bacterium]|nr:uroporphyrinogen-III C-methyltransferase [Candidatus Schekmanbacteria bacterium]